MEFTFAHSNLNVFDLEKSIAFYNQALDLKEVKRINAPDDSFIIVYLSDGISPYQLELTWLRNWDRAYNLGDNEIHIAFTVANMDAAYQKHKDMGCICYENPKMGIYFINDPDGYWLEIIREKK